MASTDARYLPEYYTAHRVSFALKDANDDVVVGATNLSSSRSRDGAVFSATANSVVEIGSGFYYLDLTNTDLIARTIIVFVTADNTKPYTEVIYPAYRTNYNLPGHPVTYAGEVVKDTAVRVPYLMIDPVGGAVIEGKSVGAYTIRGFKNDGLGTPVVVTAKGEYGDGWYYMDVPASLPSHVGPLVLSVWDSGVVELYASLYLTVVADAGGVDNDAIADAVWDEALSGHTTTGTAGQKLGLINTSQVTTASYLTGLAINFPRAITFDETVSGLTIPSDWDVIYLTVKGVSATAENDDERAMIQILITNGGDAGDGLQRLNGQDATADKAKGTLTVDQGEGTVQIAIQDDMLALLAAATGLQWDLKYIDTSSDSGLIVTGTASIINTVTMALS